FPETIALLRGRIPFYMKACHDKYGSIVRVSPNELCFDDAPAWRDIYGSRPGHANFHKDPIHVGSIASVPGVTTITMADDRNHARQRRALSHAFSTKALLEQEHIIKGYIDVFSKIMKDFANKGELVNMTDWLAYTTFDIIGDLSFGEPFGCLTKPEFRFWVPLISDSITAGAWEQATRRLATTDSTLQKLLLKLIPRHISDKRKHHLIYSKEKIMKRVKQTDNDHKDFLYYLMRQKDKDQLNLDEVIVNGALFIIAGTETTAGYLTGLLNNLLRPQNRHVFDKLVQEVRSSFENEDDFTFEELTKLPYMTAVIEEGHRIFPSAPIGFVRTVPHGGDTVCGEMLPGGTTVSVCNWAASHSERNFDKPYDFIPERWLDKENTTDKLHASQAFSLGPRGCIGRNLSYMEQRLILAKLVWNNDLELANHPANDKWNPKNDYENMVVFNNWVKPPLWVKMMPRNF
ncbi:uncharacterized protein PV09_02289, partial [Verruconis gallopava]